MKISTGLFNDHVINQASSFIASNATLDAHFLLIDGWYKRNKGKKIFRKVCSADVNCYMLW